MILRILLTLAITAATTGAFAEDSLLPDTPCLTEANGRGLLFLDYPEVELSAQTETYLDKRNGRLYRIELDAYILAIIGYDEATRCPSLPSSARTKQSTGHATTSQVRSELER